MTEDFEEFKRIIQKMTDRRLKEKGYDCRTVIRPFTKLYRSYTGISAVFGKENSWGQVMSLEELYEAHRAGSSLTEIAETVSEELTKEIPPVEVGFMHDYEQLRRRLFLRLASREKNRELMKKIPCKTAGDMILTYHARVSAGDDAMASIMITDSILDMLEISDGRIHEDAMASSPQVLPAEIRVLHCSEAENRMVLVTNRFRSRGASVLFYPGMMDELARIFGGSYYVVPSSTEEIFLCAERDEERIEAIRSFHYRYVHHELPEDIFLSDRIYWYNAEERCLMNDGKTETVYREK